MGSRAPGPDDPPWHGEEAARRRWWRAPTACWVTIAVVLLFTQRVALWLGGGPLFGGADQLVGGWHQFDSFQYVAIATHGYWFDPRVPSNIVWFPLFPLLTRLLAPIVGSTRIAAFGVSSVAGLAAAVLYWRWILDRVPQPARRFAWLALFVSPYAIFLYGAVYPTSLFLALSVAAFLCIERRRPVLAGVLGAFATAARPTGLCLVPALLLLELERSGVLSTSVSATRRWLSVRIDRTKLQVRSVGPLLSLVGVGCYSLYLGLGFGAPVAWLTNESQFHRDPQSWFHREWLQRLSAWVDRGWADPLYPASTVVQAAMVVAVLVSSPLVGRRYGWGYGLFTALLALVPLWGISDFFGAGRYVLVAFPAFSLLGERLARRPQVAWVVTGTSGLVLVLLAAAFARGWYLS